MYRNNFLKPAIIVLFIGLIFIWMPVFMNYYGLMEADFLASNSSFENTDLEMTPLGPKFPLLLMGMSSFFLQWVANLLMVLWRKGPVRFFESELLPLRC